MTARNIHDKGFNLNTILLCVSLVSGIITAVWFIEPLRTLPNDMQNVQSDLHLMKNVQAVQSEALKTLAEVAKDSRDLRRDFDKHSSEQVAKNREQDHDLENVQKRLDRIETK